MDDLTALPSSFAAGTTVNYRREFADYPANDGWTLTVHLKGRSAANIAGAPAITTDGTAFVVEISATATAELRAGRYEWAELVTKSGVGTKLAGAGTLQVTPNVAVAGPGDLQSANERILDALIARREFRLTVDQETIQCDGMAISRIPWDTLDEKISKYQALVNAERRGSGAQVNLIGWSRYR